MSLFPPPSFANRMPVWNPVAAFGANVPEGGVRNGSGVGTMAPDGKKVGPGPFPPDPNTPSAKTASSTTATPGMTIFIGTPPLPEAPAASGWADRPPDRPLAEALQPGT